MKINKGTLFAIKKAIQRNGWIELPADGTSMFPLIKRGSICRFALCEASALKKGDIVLFQAAGDQLVAHRFLEIKKNGRHMRYLFKGDTNLGMDAPVTDDRIIGKLIFIRKGNRTMHTTGLIFLLWCRIVLAFPIVSSLLRSFLNKKEAQK